MVGGLCGLAALGAALAPGAATQHPVIDVLWRIGLAVAVTLAATRATPSTWILALALALIVSTQDTVAFFVTLAVFAVAVALVVLDHTGPVVGAIIGASTVQLLLRLPATHPTGLGTLAAGVAVGTIVFSAIRRSPAPTRRRVMLGAAGVGAGALLATLLFGVVVLWANSQLQAGVDAAQAGIDAARLGDTRTALRDFEAARRDLAGARSKLDSSLVVPARGVPIVAQHEHALRKLVDNAATLVSVGDRAARDADIGSLRVVQGRLDPADRKSVV